MACWLFSSVPMNGLVGQCRRPDRLVRFRDLAMEGLSARLYRSRRTWGAGYYWEVLSDSASPIVSACSTPALRVVR
jgi:hypothetical protein